MTKRKRPDVWNTYAERGFDGPHGKDRRADGGITLCQVRRKTARLWGVLLSGTPTYHWTWQERRVNVNGCFVSEGEPWSIPNGEGMALWEQAKKED